MKDILINYFKTLAPIEESEISILESMYSRVDFSEKQYLLHAGDVCQDVFFIIKGIVRIGVFDQGQNDITINFRQEGEFVSDYKSFIKEEPASFVLQALEDTICLKTDRYGFEKMYRDIENGNLIGRKIMENIFFELYEMLISFHTDSAETRYIQLLEAGELVNRIPQNYLASYIGVQPQSLSRIKRRYLESQSNADG